MALVNTTQQVLDSFQLPKKAADANIRLRVVTESEVASPVGVKATEVLTSSFMEYKAFKWVAEGVENPDLRATAQRATVEWVSKYSISEATATGVLVVAEDPKTDDVVGVLTVFDKAGLSVNPLMKAIQRKWRYAGLSWRLMVGRNPVGVPPPFVQSGWEDLPRRFSTLDQMENQRQEEMASQRHLFLNQVGVNPASQGLGVGGALLSLFGAIADTVELEGYLETNETWLRDFYCRNGFQVVRDYVVDATGPVPLTPNFGMRRPVGGSPSRSPEGTTT